MKNSKSESYAAAGVDITAGYKAVELMKKHIARTKNEGCVDDVGGFGGCFGLPIAGMEEPVLVSGTDGCGTKVKIDRPLNMLIPTDSRPLSSDRMALENLYMTRYPIYTDACDSRIEAIGTPIEIAENILENYL